MLHFFRIWERVDADLTQEQINTHIIVICRLIKGAAISRKKDIVKNTLLVLFIWNLHSIFPWWFLTWCISEKMIRRRWRHNDGIRRHDVNNWDMKFGVDELEVIVNKRPPCFLWLSSPIMKYKVLILLSARKCILTYKKHVSGLINL